MSLKKEFFFTRDFLNRPARIPLIVETRSLGEPCGPDDMPEEWIDVRSTGSDAFRDACVADADTPGSEEAKKLRTAATLIVAWSLDEPCTPEAVTALLRENTDIRNKVLIVAMDRAVFFGAKSIGSSSLPIDNSSSNVSLPTQSKPSAQA
jgi:hypothetical protein